MAGKRHRTLWLAAGGIVLVWILAWAGFVVSRSAKITPDMVRAYAGSLDLSKLSAEERAKALRELAREMNSLTFDERRGLRPDTNLLNQLTEEERAALIEATMPTEIKQALMAFENMPEDRRQRVIDNAMKNLKSNPDGSGRSPQLTPADEAKIRSLGLKTYYNESSAETKAELAPLLNEIQNQMQNGRGPH